MSEVGNKLKEEREARGLQRADVSRDTGILIHHLAALEHGNFEELPDDETVAGFVRKYAEYLGFFADEPVAEFCAERGIEVPGATPKPTVESSPTRPEKAPVQTARRPLWPWIVVGAIVIVILLWVGMRGEPEGEPVVGAHEEVGTAEPEPEESVPEAPVEAKPPAVEPPAVEPAPVEAAPPPAAPESTLSVTEHGVGTGVENHRLVGESDRFAEGTRVFFWTRVRGGAPGREVHHVWIHEGRGSFPVTLPLGSANWRTQSAKTLYAGSAGRWTVEARDEAGNVLARSRFICER
jgi:transcriptional regulator with XRE-family HTH domain